MSKTIAPPPTPTKTDTIKNIAGFLNNRSIEELKVKESGLFKGWGQKEYTSGNLSRLYNALIDLKASDIENKMAVFCTKLKFDFDTIPEYVKSTKIAHEHYKNKVQPLDYFKDRFKGHLEQKNEYLANKEVNWDNRRFDSLSRLIASDSSCAAVCFDGKKLIIAFNEIHEGNKDSKSQIISSKLSLTKDIFNYFKDYTKAAGGEKDGLNNFKQKKC